jgi:hypothetical protein
MNKDSFYFSFLKAFFKSKNMTALTAKTATMIPIDMGMMNYKSAIDGTCMVLAVNAD